MDGDGIPLAFNITPGNTNEQTTLTPTEQKILDDFKLSKFIVCTDAGLASTANRKFNDKEDRAFITTQSIKKLKKHLKEWALSPTGWKLNNDTKQYDISKLEDTSESIEKYKNKVFYKERWIKENGLEQKLIVTFSLKYKFYQQKIRNNQIERAQKAMENKSFKLDKINQNDFKRFITKTSVTKDDEVAEKKILSLNTNQIEKELNEKYTASEIIDTLRNMNLTKNCDEGYIPSYTRTDITDCLHEKFNFRTDYEIMKNTEIKKILNFIKK